MARASMNPPSKVLNAWSAIDHERAPDRQPADQVVHSIGEQDQVPDRADAATAAGDVQPVAELADRLGQQVKQRPPSSDPAASATSGSSRLSAASESTSVTLPTKRDRRHRETGDRDPQDQRHAARAPYAPRTHGPRMALTLAEWRGLRVRPTTTAGHWPESSRAELRRALRPRAAACAPLRAAAPPSQRRAVRRPAEGRLAGPPSAPVG
jgi:hypothetical protein